MSPTATRVRATLVLTASLALVVVGAPASTADAPHGHPLGPGSDGPSRGDSLPFSWQIVSTGSIGNLMGLDVVDEDVVWASVDRHRRGDPSPSNGGDSFEEVAPPEGFDEGLQFFDIEANSADVATVLSGGARSGQPGLPHRDGGESWDEMFRSEDDSSFFNCMAFFDEQRGVARVTRSTASSRS